MTLYIVTQQRYDHIRTKLKSFDLKHICRYLKNGVLKSIVRVIKHANFQPYRVHLLFRKPDNWRQIYKQMIPTLYTSNDVSRSSCLITF